MLAAWTGISNQELARAHASFPAEIARVMPPSFGDMLAAAIAQEVRDGSGRDAQLRRHYFEIMPALRAEQLDARREPQATLLHTRLDLARMPRLAAGLTRLYALLARAGVPAEQALPARSPEELVARYPTIAALYPETYYGGFMPMLYAYPADLASFTQELAHASCEEVIDRRLAAPLIHELAHLAPRRRALLPLYLDEGVAGHLGVLALPELAYPAPGEDNGLYAAPWLSQVGRAMVRVAGLERLLRAHAGLTEWPDALSERFLRDALAHGWEEYLSTRAPHFLSNNFRPEWWLGRIHSLATWRAGTPEEDTADLADALRAMCLDNHLVTVNNHSSFRVRTRAPRGPIRIDLVRGWMSALGGPYDPEGLGHHVPPFWAIRLEASGTRTLLVEMHDAGVIPELASVLQTAVHPVERPGFRIAAEPTQP